MTVSALIRKLQKMEDDGYGDAEVLLNAVFIAEQLINGSSKDYPNVSMLKVAHKKYQATPEQPTTIKPVIVIGLNDKPPLVIDI